MCDKPGGADTESRTFTGLGKGGDRYSKIVLIGIS